jgi:hypothetical protein
MYWLEIFVALILVRGVELVSWWLDGMEVTWGADELVALEFGGYEDSFCLSSLPFW